MPRQAQPREDSAILEMAIVGYENQRERLTARIAEIKAQLGQAGPGRPKATVTGSDHVVPQKRRKMSKSARARIAAAQRARWAAQKQQQAVPEKPKKRKMSAAGLRAIREATKKRWAAYRKAHKSKA
ncbi:MAG: hypothetical protein ABSH32_04215 [Bryobacteraceae bacterium]|jgi:hypothetical protein